MTEYIKINIFLELADKFPVFDVRSPIEFSQGSITGAINFPLFTDEERAKVGTRFKRSGKNDATMLALDLIGPKLSDYIRKAGQLTHNNEILMYCWRGGMRSSSLAWLLELAGYKVYVLEGGYKAYRRYVREYFEQYAKIIILAGMTGSGKSELLKRLEEKGEQVIDIEDLAKHKGSVLGSLGYEIQPTNEQFENILFSKWSKLDLSRRIWLEDESFQLGYVNIPKPLYLQMNIATAIHIKVDKNIRIERLVNEYAHFDIALLKESINKLEKKTWRFKYKKYY